MTSITCTRSEVECSSTTMVGFGVPIRLPSYDKRATEIGEAFQRSRRLECLLTPARIMSLGRMLQDSEGEVDDR